MKATIALAAALLIIGCDGSKPAVSTAAAPNNASFTVSVLFTDADGFTVKRFYDSGEQRYYVTGPAPAAALNESTRTETTYYTDSNGNLTPTTTSKHVPNTISTTPRR